MSAKAGTPYYRSVICGLQIDREVANNGLTHPNDGGSKDYRNLYFLN